MEMSRSSGFQVLGPSRSKMPGTVLMRTPVAWASSRRRRMVAPFALGMASTTWVMRVVGDERREHPGWAHDGDALEADALLVEGIVHIADDLAAQLGVPLDLLGDEQPGPAGTHNEGALEGSGAGGCGLIEDALVPCADGGACERPSHGGGEAGGEEGVEAEGAVEIGGEVAKDLGQQAEGERGPDQTQGVPEADVAVLLPGEAEAEVDQPAQGDPGPQVPGDGLPHGQEPLAGCPGPTRQDEVKGQLDCLAEAGVAQQGAIGGHGVTRA